MRYEMELSFDFAFSFAGEDREVIEQIKDGLDKEGFSIFYDNDYSTDLCGKDLYSYLRDLYMNRCKYVVCFLSSNYQKKIWTNLELTAIKERLMSTFFASDFLIPIILEENTIPKDIPSFIGFHKFKDIINTINFLRDKYNRALNEDFYLEAIHNFSIYLLGEIANSLQECDFQTEKNRLIVPTNSQIVKFILVPEDFSKLPCLLIFNDDELQNPVGMITWKRQENILFTLNFFNILAPDSKDITLNELIAKVKIFILR